MNVMVPVDRAIGMAPDEAHPFFDGAGLRHLGLVGFVRGDERVEVGEVALRTVGAEVLSQTRPDMAVTRHHDHWILR